LGSRNCSVYNHQIVFVGLSKSKCLKCKKLAINNISSNQSQA
jgi:hypothetical protein